MISKTHTKIIDRAEVGTWVAAVIALGMHYSGSLTMAPEVVGATLAAALLPIAMGAVRFLNRVLDTAPEVNPRSDAPEASDESGFASIATLPVTLIVGILLMLTFSGCGSTYTLRAGGWNLEQADCGTRLTVYGDGDPEVSVICIAEAGPLKVGPKVRKALCEGN